MWLTILKLIKWTSLPMLLIGSPLSQYALSYEFVLNIVICLGALVWVQWAVRLKEYFWAAGFVGIAVVFSPLPLVVKIFFTMGLACFVMFATLLATFRVQPSPVRHS